MKTFNLYHILIAFCTCVSQLSCTKEKVNEIQQEHTDNHGDENVELTAAQARTAGIELGKVENKQISGTIKVNGVLDVPPQQLVSISVPLGGFVKNTSLLQGSRVKKGQVIATIENLDFIQIQQDYLEAKGQLELTEADYQRQQELAKENINSQKTLQQAKANLTTWRARYNALREKLNVININVKELESGVMTSAVNLYSPIGGYVTAVNVNIGKFVTPTDVIFEIVDTEHLHAELIVFEKDVRKLKIGQKVRFTLANETEDRMATIYLIGREIGKERTVQVHCHIDEEDTELLPGMYLSALVETGGALVPALPDEAIIDYNGKKYIFIVSEDGHARMQEETTQNFSMVEIQVSHRELGFTEVVIPDSLIAEAVVVKGAYALLSKMKNTEEEGVHAH
ncbi:MAG TPA: efflux RND transporter periplasmic adaptor subunit [Chryseolinea sp.]